MRRRATAACALATGALLGAAVTVGAAPTPSAAAPTSDLAKGKCKRGQVLVKLQGKKSCQPRSAALPRPQKGDQRLSIVESAVTFDPSALRDRDGKQLPSPADVYGAFGPGAYDAVKRELPRALARLDELGTTGAAWQMFATRSAAACPSPGTPTPTGTASYRSDVGGGVTLTVTATAASSSSITLALEKGGDGLKVELDLGQCKEQQGFKAESCPTAAGVVDGTYDSYLRSVTTVRKDGVVTYSLALRINQLTQLHGQVGEDAKLDSLVVDDAVRIESALVGSSRVPVSFTATVKRHTRVDMHTGNYDPGAASLLDVSVDVDGVANDAEAVAAVSSKLQESSGKDFSEAVARAIKEYRSREAGWHKPNACATLQFTPASGTLHLHAGQSGHFTGQVKASRGGTSSGRWHLVGRQNATISPSSARGTEPTFVYHVTSGSPQAAVSATFETTSRAGVAKGTWSQNQRRLPRVWRGTVVNQFKSTEGGQTNFTRVDASVTFTLSKVRSHFGVTEYDYTISGTVKFETSFAGAGCTIEGAGAWDIKPSWGHMDITVTATAAGTHTLYFFEASRVPYTVTYHSVMQCRTGSGIETTTSEEPFGGFEGPQFSRPMRIDARTIDGEEVGDKGNGFNRWHLVAVD